MRPASPQVSHIRPKELGAVVLLDEQQIVRAVGREHRVHVGGFLQPEASLNELVSRQRREEKRREPMFQYFQGRGVQKYCLDVVVGRLSIYHACIAFETDIEGRRGVLLLPETF